MIDWAIAFVREVPQLVESALPGFPDASLKEDGDAGWPIASYPQPMDPVNLNQKLSQFTEHWPPCTIAQLNNQDIMVVKAKGEFVWHKHDDTDDFFLVLKGQLNIELRDRTVAIGPGELFIVPKGVEHRPVADEEVHLLLIEPTGTPNTGDPSTAALRRIL